MKNSLVSIVMSVYNSENSIAKSIESLIGQKYENTEILLMDDCSTDNTFKICKEYSDSNPKINLYKNDKNIGLTKSLNYLIKKSKGPYIARQDADDISDPTRIQKQIDYMTMSNLDACSTRAFVIDSNLITPSKSYYLPKNLIMKIKNPFIHGTLVIKKEVIQKIGMYDERFYYSQDYKLMSDFLSKGYKVKILKEPLYYLNMKGNISVKNKVEQNYYAECVRKNINPQKADR
tara:strand:- start:900 stop:1598 length:699 start_codon:yes stop_codon:yes gene_type:complete